MIVLLMLIQAPVLVDAAAGYELREPHAEIRPMRFTSGKEMA